jgi:hypothetical protein
VNEGRDADPALVLEHLQECQVCISKMAPAAGEDGRRCPARIAGLLRIDLLQGDRRKLPNQHLGSIERDL